VPEIIECEQGTEEWLQARLGIPTASEFHSVLGRQWGGEGDAKVRRWYLLRLIGERITGEPSNFYTNPHMERGKKMESAARHLYRFLTDEDTNQVGFIRSTTGKGRPIGCSPDSLIGTRGMVEIKTKLPHLHLDVILNNRVPPEHYAQCQGALWVADRDWIDFVSYWPKMDPFIFRIERDEPFITHLEREIEIFWDDLERIEQIVRAGKILEPIVVTTPRQNPIRVENF